MSPPYTFRIDGVPVAQPRQRVAVRAGHAVNYTPSKHPVNEFKTAVRIAAGKEIPQPFDGPVQVSLLFILPRPKSKIWKSRPMPQEWAAKKPDCDNLAKAVLDAMAGCWRDDAQVCRLDIWKKVAAGDEQPHVMVTVQELESNPPPATSPRTRRLTLT